MIVTPAQRIFCTRSTFLRRAAWLFAGMLTGLLPIPEAAAQREIDIGRVDVRGGREVIPIQIVSSNAEFKQLAERAFQSHGAYRVARDRGSAAFVFAFQPGSNSSSVNLEITAGSGTHRETVAGSDARNALFRAADIAVAKTTGQPGFFAGKITFVAERSRGAREVFVSDLFLTQVRAVTNDGADSVGPRWSPDGQSILYTSYYRNGFPDIFKIDMITRRRTPFVQVKGTNTGARFSPDGTQVAMTLSGAGNPEVYISNAAGKNIRRLTRTDAVESSPSWSPDGRRLVFTSDRNGRPQLFVMNASGGEMSRIPTNISGNCTEPDWNPRDPNQIIFTAAVGGRFALALYDFTKRESRFLTQGSGDAVAPCWTNDGRHVIFTHRTASTSNLMLLDTQTGKTTRLSDSRLGKASHADFWIGR